MVSALVFAITVFALVCTAVFVTMGTYSYAYWKGREVGRHEGWFQRRQYTGFQSELKEDMKEEA